MENQQTVRYKLDTKGPIELELLTDSLGSFAAEFHRQTAQNARRLDDSRTRLFVTKVSSGSVIADLLPMLQDTAGLVVTNYHTLMEFCGNLKTTFEFLRGVVKREPEIDKKKLQAVRAILKPLNEGNGTQLNITGDIKNYGTINIIVPKKEALQISDRAEALIKEIDAEKVDTVDGVTLRLYQARNDSSKSGDKAIIEDIYPKPVKVMFAGDKLKHAMLLSHGNPFLLQYKVDVVVDKKGERPTAYRVTKLHKVEKLNLEG